MLTITLAVSAAMLAYAATVRKLEAALAWVSGRLNPSLTLLKRDDAARPLAVALGYCLPVAAVAGGWWGGFTGALLFSGATMALPLVIVRRLALRRVALIERQFPAALDSLAAALRAGQSLTQAVGWTARETPEPTAAEFGRLDRELRLGRTPEQVFGDWSFRLPAAGPRAIALTLGPLRSAGANLIPAFEALAENLRRRAGSEEKMGALAAQAKMQLRLLSVLTPAMAGVLLVLDPQVARRLLAPEGIGVLGLAAALQAAGVVTAKRILNPKTLWRDTGGPHGRQ